VVILVVDERGVFAFKCKREPPILIHPYSPTAFLIPSQGMQSPAWYSHIIRTARRMKPAELELQPHRMLRLDAGLRARTKARLEPPWRKERTTTGSLYSETTIHNGTARSASEAAIGNGERRGLGGGPAMAVVRDAAPRTMPTQPGVPSRLLGRSSSSAWSVFCGKRLSG